MTPSQQLEQDLRRMPETANERSLYKPLCIFLENFSNSLYKTDSFNAIAEESGSHDDAHIGFPDITMRKLNNVVGWIEVKLPKDSLDKPQFNEQFKRYKNSLQNLIITNLNEWQLWQWNEDSKPVLISKITWNAGAQLQSSDAIDNFLKRFLEGIAFEVRTPKQLAIALARKAQLLSRQVEETLAKVPDNHSLNSLRKTFEQTLVDNLKPHQFANMVAETIAYSLFLAKLEHENRNDNRAFDTHAADRYLPRNVPILKDLYELVLRVANDLPSINQGVQSLVDQLNVADIERIRHKLVDHKAGEDPVIQFYEPFLAEYDPKERESRGVYYTPKPVVDYIVRSVDSILRSKFHKSKGLADDSLSILDPATGTGTFLMSSIQEIYYNIKKDNSSLGDEMVKREFNSVTLNHILKHFYGFELLIAPYAVAHLKLTLEIERLGFDFSLTETDMDSDNDRFKVYLANTLDDPNKPPQSLFGFESIPQESESARKVKNDIPILAIIGNPPYSVSSSNKGKWIEKLMATYKEDVKNEKNIQPLSDDYVKFIRFGQWKIQQTGQGVFAMITNNSFLSGRIHRGMRKELLNTYDQIYILNLHGSAVTGEIAPDDIDDHNVFSIRQGVSISFFVKNGDSGVEDRVMYADLWGSKAVKFEYLASNTLDTTKWTKIDVSKDPNCLFIPRDERMDEEYSAYKSLSEIMPIFTSGVKTHRDELVIRDNENDLHKNINAIIEDFDNTSKIMSLKESSSFNARKIKGLNANEINQSIKQIQYRPFDRRYIIFHPNFIERHRLPKIGHMLKPNLALITKKGQYFGQNNFLISNGLSELRFASAPGTIGTDYIFPLYLYETSTQGNFFGQDNRKANFSTNFVDEFSKNIDLAYEQDGEGDLINSFGPESLLYYVYAIFYSNSYRSRFREQLKRDFPQIPIANNKKYFLAMVDLGKRLVSIHLLGENPFDRSKTVFDNPDSWSIAIGGRKPINLEDWQVRDVRYESSSKRVYVNDSQFFEGVEDEVWSFVLGGYQVCEKWLKDKKKLKHILTTDDLKHYMKILVAIRETIKIQKEIDATGFMDVNENAN